MATMLAVAPVLTSEVVSQRSGKYEFIAWADGEVTIEDARYQFHLDESALDHVCLPANVVRTLRTFMNSERVIKFLDNPRPIDEGEPECYVSCARMAYYELKQALSYEFLVFADGVLTLEHLLWSILRENKLDHAEMQVEDARALRDFLNTEPVMLAIGAARSADTPDIVA
jgi:hypothetical protein